MTLRDSLIRAATHAKSYEPNGVVFALKCTERGIDIHASVDLGYARGSQEGWISYDVVEELPDFVCGKITEMAEELIKGPPA